MSCGDFERWLDAGRPEAERAVAHAHAARCGRCAENLAAADAVEALLARPATQAPPSFTADVMRQVAAEPRRRARLAGSPPEPTFPWWIQSLLQPEMVLAAVLAAITIGAAPRLLSFLPSLLDRGSVLAATTARPDLPAVPLSGGLPSLGSLPPSLVLALGSLLIAGATYATRSLYRWGTTRA